MKEVRIYLYSTVKGARACDGAYTYILETDTSKGNATITKTEKVINMTANKAILCALLSALGRVHQSSYLIIYTDSHYMAANAKDCLSRWNKNGWKTARGKPVEHQEEWKQIHHLLMAHSVEFVVNSEHSYYQWMKTESEKAAKCI